MPQSQAAPQFWKSRHSASSHTWSFVHEFDSPIHHHWDQLQALGYHHPGPLPHSHHNLDHPHRLLHQLHETCFLSHVLLFFFHPWPCQFHVLWASCLFQKVSKAELCLSLLASCLDASPNNLLQHDPSSAK